MNAKADEIVESKKSGFPKCWSDFQAPQISQMHCLHTWNSMVLRVALDTVEEKEVIRNTAFNLHRGCIIEGRQGLYQYM